MFQSARRVPDSALARIDDDRKILHRSLHKVLRTMSRGGVKEQCIARLNQASAIGMAIPNLAGQHVDDFDAGVAELGAEGVGSSHRKEGNGELGKGFGA